jgi:hypothetical protein
MNNLTIGKVLVIEVFILGKLIIAML